MSKVCLGCGVVLQNRDQNTVGYSPKEASLYCQRCFRLTNYGEFVMVKTEGIENDVILDKINKVQGTLLWVVDLLDLEASFSEKNMAIFRQKPCILILSKHDLLPKTMTANRIISYIQKRLKVLEFDVVAIFLNQIKGQDRSLQEKIVRQTTLWPIYVVGMANVGKSTFLNHLANQKQLTVSRHPNTTLAFNHIKIDQKEFIDTPGLSQEASLLSQVAQGDLKYLIPTSPIKPKIYQVYEDQSFALGGLIRVDLKCHKSCSIVFYMSEYIVVHRGKLANANDLWSNHYQTLLVPPTKQDYTAYQATHFKSRKNEIEIAIAGLGWLKVEGPFDELIIYGLKEVALKEREGYEAC